MLESINTRLKVKQESCMINLPIGRQTFDFDCGAKALQIVMAYYGVDIREDKLMEKASM